MAMSLLFVQPCPTCGRNQQVRVAYLGKAITCQHCHADFVAQQPGEIEQGPAPSESGLALLDRADQLLLQLAQAKKEAESKSEASVPAAVQ